MALKTVFLIVHVLGVVLGVGGVLMLDVHLLRHLRGARIMPQDVKLTQFVSLFVKVGLVAVWASGLIIIALAPDGPASVLANPKLQAKLVVVVVLTINALFIETLALPLLEGNVGQALFYGVDQIRRTVILGCAAVSTLSWTYPIGLGLARELNGVVPAQLILTDYAVMLACLAIVMQVAGRVLYRPRLDTAAMPGQTSFSAGDTTARAQTPTFGVNRPSHGAAVDAWIVRAANITPERGLRDVRQMGRSAIRASVAPEQVLGDFAALGTDEERHLFRTGLFEGLNERSGFGLDAEGLLEVVATDEALRRKFASVAPDGAARDAFASTVQRSRREAEDKMWAKVREWHSSMVALNTGGQAAMPDDDSPRSAMAS